MGKSFVLKDAAGRPGGYLTQGMREICCRADAQAQQAVLLFEDGTAEERPLCGGQEARWPDDGRMLRGGFVCADGRLLLASGEEARGAFERMIIQKHAAREKTQPRTETCQSQCENRRRSRMSPRKRRAHGRSAGGRRRPAGRRRNTHRAAGRSRHKTSRLTPGGLLFYVNG